MLLTNKGLLVEVYHDELYVSTPYVVLQKGFSKLIADWILHYYKNLRLPLYSLCFHVLVYISQGGYRLNMWLCVKNNI